MARPARNNAEYFTHPAGFHNDRRVKALRTRFGAAGYGLLMMLFEALTDADHTQLPTDELELELLAGDFGVSVTEIDSLLQAAEKTGLFARNEQGFLICPDLNKWLEPVFEKRNRARNAEKVRLSAVSVTETPVTVAENPQSKVKESKEEKRKEKEKKETAASATSATGLGSGLCLMRDSPVASLDAFRLAWQALNETRFADVDLEHYHASLLDWSDSKGEKKRDWVATIRGSMRRDQKDGKLVTTTRPANSTPYGGQPGRGGGTGSPTTAPRDINETIHRQTTVRL